MALRKNTRTEPAVLENTLRRLKVTLNTTENPKDRGDAIYIFKMIIQKARCGKWITWRQESHLFPYELIDENDNFQFIIILM